MIGRTYSEAVQALAALTRGKPRTLGSPVPCRSLFRGRARVFLWAALCTAFLFTGASPAWALEGDLDTSFSNDGKTTTPVGTGVFDEGARDVVLQPDGKLVAGGKALGVGTGSDFAVARYDADGELDRSFGTEGRVLTDMGSQAASEQVHAVALQPDGKIVAVGTTGQQFVGTGLDIAVARYNPNGTLDTSFSEDGELTLHFGATSDSDNAAFGAALQPDGKIVAAGTTQDPRNPGSADLTLVRLNPNGSLDTNFDADGIVITNLSGSDTASAVALQTNEKIVAVGRSGNDFALARYNANGSLDSSFDTDGIVITDMGSSTDSASDLAFQVDGKIVVAGEANFNFAVARYNTNGSLDTAFDTDGRQTTNFGSIDTARGLVVTSDNRVTVAGSTGINNNSDFALARYNANGALDTSFSGDGTRTTDFGDTGDAARAIALQGDGKAVVAGTSGSRFALARYRSGSGDLDSTFSLNGKVATVVSTGGEDVAESVALQPDGKTVAAGRSPGPGGQRDAISVVRYNTNGTLDSSFGGDGKVLTELEVGSQGEGVAVQPDGKILVAATALSANRRFAVLRYNPDGTLDASFSFDGIQTTGFGDSEALAEAIALQPDGRIVVAGTLLGSNIDFALARFNPNGSLDSTFDGDGKVTTPIGPGVDLARAMTLQGDKIVVAGEADESADAGAREDFAVARYNPDGSLDSTFDGDGRVTTPVGVPGSFETVRAVLALPGGKIVAGGEADAGGFNSGFALVRYNGNGSLDDTFSGDGILIDPSLDGTVHGLASQGGTRILAAGPVDGNFGLVRYNASGTLDTNFSGDGKVTTDFGPCCAAANALAVGADSRITVAGSFSNGGDSDFAVARYIGDATAPTVERVVPAENATGVATGADVNAFFSEDMTATSINASTVKLFEAGKTTPVKARVRYDAETRKSTLDPGANLRRGVRYKATVTTKTRDLAGNRLDQNPSSGNQPKTWFFKIKD